MDYLVFKASNKYYGMFNVAVSVNCLVSSYTYLYFAAFRWVEDPDSDRFILTLIFEGVFFIYMILQFFVDNTPAYQDSSNEM